MACFLDVYLIGGVIAYPPFITFHTFSGESETSFMRTLTAPGASVA